MECYRTRELIQEKIEGALSPQLGRELERHLASCRECHAYAEGIEALDSLMSRQPLEGAPEGFAARVLEAASRRRGRVLSFERKNLRIAAACVAAALILVAILPFFVALPDTRGLTGKLAALTPQLPETGELTSQLAALTPAMPESAPTIDDAVGQIRYSWELLREFEVPALGLTGTFTLLLGLLGAIAVTLEAVYLALPYRRKR